MLKRTCANRFLLPLTLVLMITLALNCSQSQVTITPENTITKDQVNAHIKFLSSDEMKGRDPFTDDIKLSENYIAEQFSKAGLKEFSQFPGYKHEFEQEYRPRRQPDAEPKTYNLTNIVGYIEGTDPVLKDEFIMFGAHHDHLGIRGDAEDNIYNGADDNAAGTVGVIALAEYFAKKGGNKRSIIFATFTAEEKGLLGSFKLAQNLPFPNENLKCLINFEMIGKPAEDGSYTLLMLGPEHSTIDEIMTAAVPSTAPVQFVMPAENQLRYFFGSDNVAFHREGFITTTIASPYSTSDPDYHKPSDEYELLNIDYMTKAIRTVAHAATALIDGPTVPEKTAAEEQH